MEIGNLPEKEFRITMVKMTQDLREKNGGNIRKRVQNNDREDDPGSWGKGWRPRQKEFRIMIVKINQDLRERTKAKIEKMQETFTKDLEELKKKQTEVNNT